MDWAIVFVIGQQVVVAKLKIERIFSKSNTCEGLIRGMWTNGHNPIDERLEIRLLCTDAHVNEINSPMKTDK